MGRIKKLSGKLGIRYYTPIKFMLDLSVWVLAAPLAFMLRLDDRYLQFGLTVLSYTVVAAAIKAILISIFAMHRQSWHKVGVRDLLSILKATGIAVIALSAAGFVLNPLVGNVPRSIPILDCVIGLLGLSGIRLAVRVFDEYDRRSKTQGPTRNVLIAGAGETGTLLVREMLRHPEARMMPVGYLDDEQAKHGRSYVGFPVLGRLEELPKLAKEHGVNELLIAMPSAPGTTIRELITLARDAKIKYRIFPGLYEILSEKVSITQLREVNVEDLLRRAPVRLNMENIAAYLEDQVVLVTGAAGTIGSEIIHQVARFSPRKMILIDRNENSLYLQELALREQYPYLDFTTFIADIQRPEKLERIFARHRPDVVFHAAAHKHVPFMDLNPDEAILNNVGGTRIVLEMALRHHVKRFVNISTDKAVEPSSVMGASKRVAEHLVARAALRSAPDQSFVSVRFGNVLGSNGSVVPIFTDQIRRGGPVTITHPEMTRYFMSVPEAVQLVLQAGSLGENGAIYILDMGDPVKIIDLANDLIRLSGFEPGEDISVKFTGKRPGEKLFEELCYSEENVEPSGHEKISVVRPHALPDRFDENLEALIAAACVSDPKLIHTHLKVLIPSFKHFEQEFGY